MALDKITLNKIKESFLEKAVDAVLLAIYFNLEAPGLIRNKRYLIEDRVSEDLGSFNYQTIKRAVVQLRQKGVIQYLKEKNTLPEITKNGEDRLNKLIPFYDEKRIWDGRIYLVSYDIPIDENNQRHYLREYLKTIGCGILQQSIWITPYNPTKLLKTFVTEHDLSEELILVSSIGKNGNVGNMSINELMEKVFCLNNLNRRYLEFITGIKEKKESKGTLVFWYLSILKDDPQIPFSLLPDDWLGDKAYQYFQTLNSRK